MIKKRYYTTYYISGLNLDRLINLLKTKGIELINVRKKGAKGLFLTLNAFDNAKFFAIIGKLCYNVKKVRESGALFPLYYLIKHIGVFVGLIVLFAAALYFDNTVLKVEYFGSGAVYKREVNEYLSQNGVNEFALFSSLDLDALGDGILKENSHLSFASCKKSGSTLKVELILSTENVKTLSNDCYALYSTENGVVESVKAYRGTAVVNVGDTVKVGDLLVDGYALIKETRIVQNVIASVTVRAEREYEYMFSALEMESQALIMAEQETGDAEILSSKVICETSDSGYIYRVSLGVKIVIYS